MNGREAVFRGSVLGNPSSRYALSRYAPYAPPRHHTRAGPPLSRRRGGSSCSHRPLRQSLPLRRSLSRTSLSPGTRRPSRRSLAAARGERLARRAARTGRELRVREESSVEGGAGGETGANGGAYREIAAQRAAGRHRGLPCTSSFSINVDLQFCTEGFIKIYPECCSQCGPS